MYIENMIYIYMWLCVCLIFFDCFWVLWAEYDEKLNQEKRNKLHEDIKKQLKKIELGETIDLKHNKYLTRKLGRIKYLMAFHQILTTYENNNDERIKEYILSIRVVFLQLAIKYKKTDSMKKAYFAYVCSMHNIVFNEKNDKITETLLSYLYDDSIYVRENVMKALYSFSDAVSVMRGIRILDRQEAFYHGKLLTDGLLTFKGDHEELMELLWEKFDFFSINFRVSIINYFRFKSDNYCYEIYGLLVGENTHPEIKYAAIRYFGKYEYEPAKKELISLLSSQEKIKWEYAALSAAALLNYPSETVKIALKNALYSRNWYVRQNAAKSLAAMDFDCDEIASVLDGDDRFAKEILMYSMQYENTSCNIAEDSLAEGAH